jgi:hypothetical protein
MVVDLFLVYQFIKRLVTPFKEWKAFEYGIIDEDGNILRKRKDLKTVKERDSWGKFDVMILKLKKLLEKVPGGKSRLASYAAALWLIKEGKDHDENMLTEELLEDKLQSYMNMAEELMSEAPRMKEDAPVNAAGSGAIAGIGVGPDGEPGMPKKKQKEYLKKNKSMPLKRFKATVK